MREIGSDRGPEERGTAMGRGRKENARGRGEEESRMFKRQMGRRESESTGSEAHRASGQGGSVELKKEKLKIRTVILSGGTIRWDVPFDFPLNQSDLLQLVLTGSILFLVSSKLIFFFFFLQFWNLMHF